MEFGRQHRSLCSWRLTELRTSLNNTVIIRRRFKGVLLQLITSRCDFFLSEKFFLSRANSFLMCEIISIPSNFLSRSVLNVHRHTSLNAAALWTEPPQTEKHRWGSMLPLDGDDPVAVQLRASGRRLVGVAVFSGVVNLLTLSGSLYMLQVCVIPSQMLRRWLGYRRSW